MAVGVGKIDDNKPGLYLWRRGSDTMRERYSFTFSCLVTNDWVFTAVDMNGDEGDASYIIAG